MRQLKITKQITSRENASLDKYLQEINCEKLITVEEEAHLAQRIKEGDEKAMEKLTKANLRFVVSVAKQYQHRGLSLSDLINEGNIGLIKAARRFDASRGFKLISYAVWYIRQHIQKAIDEQSNLVRLPSGKIEIINKIRKVTKEMEQRFQREPSCEELALELCLSSRLIKEAMNANGKQISIDAPVGGSDDLTLGDMIADKDGGSVEQRLFNTSLKQEIEAVIATLSTRESDVLRFFFGLDGKRPLSLEEISNQTGVTRERVRQIKERALRKLKHTSRSIVLKEYIN